MADAELERTNVKIEANNHQEVFTASGEVIKFEGFLKVYLEGNDDDDDEQEGMLPTLKVNERLLNNNIKQMNFFRNSSFVQQLDSYIDVWHYLFVTRDKIIKERKVQGVH